ncbi:hypothetical protein L1889_07045 [Paenalcaligenes niemegkensis]|uniref:hypothetical protein n=1 Tax=Paenalcaligenes niemegkensis TaxID=2895469 RepID=UPI001EE8C3EB|nr:hypothetical protein [Paenalcaligenes niemegkensis]MCQ9616495.1 hypothetical protein [Paenalcaligenes niemegkensis]
MKIVKIGKPNEAEAGAIRAKLPGTPEIQVDERGKLAIQVTAWVPDSDGNSQQHQVVLTDGDIERLLSCLSNPRDSESTEVVGKFMQQNLRSILRLSALGAGTTLID